MSSATLEPSRRSSIRRILLAFSGGIPRWMLDSKNLRSPLCRKLRIIRHNCCHPSDYTVISAITIVKRLPDREPRSARPVGLLPFCSHNTPKQGETGLRTMRVGEYLRSLDKGGAVAIFNP